MARFYMHLVNSVGFITDEEGTEAPDLEGARNTAVTTIRALLSEEVKGGTLNLKGRIEIADSEGAELAIVSFSDAVHVMPVTDEHT